jgi:hypothetical protein
MLDILPVTGPVVSKGLWTSLSDLIVASSFDHANKDARRKEFLSSTDSAIAQELLIAPHAFDSVRSSPSAEIRK